LQFVYVTQLVKITVRVTVPDKNKYKLENFFAISGLSWIHKW